MEQFDRQRQADLDRAMAEPGATADTVITAGGAAPSWQTQEKAAEGRVGAAPRSTTFDAVIATPPQARTDPCRSLHRR